MLLISRQLAILGPIINVLCKNCAFIVHYNLLYNNPSFSSTSITTVQVVTILFLKSRLIEQDIHLICQLISSFQKHSTFFRTHFSLLDLSQINVLTNNLSLDMTMMNPNHPLTHISVHSFEHVSFLVFFKEVSQCNYPIIVMDTSKVCNPPSFFHYSIAPLQKKWKKCRLFINQ